MEQRYLRVVKTNGTHRTCQQYLKNFCLCRQQQLGWRSRNPSCNVRKFLKLKSYEVVRKRSDRFLMQWSFPDDTHNFRTRTLFNLLQLFSEGQHDHAMSGPKTPVDHFPVRVPYAARSGNLSRTVCAILLRMASADHLENVGHFSAHFLLPRGNSCESWFRTQSAQVWWVSVRNLLRWHNTSPLCSNLSA